jgi:hypothetical protein
LTTLRFGILCRGLRFPSWQAQCLQAVIGTGLAEPVLLILEGPGVKKARVFGKLRQRDRLLFNLYNALAVKTRARSYRQVDLRRTLENVPRLVCDPQVRGAVHRFHKDDVAAIRARSGFHHPLRI